MESSNDQPSPAGTMKAFTHTASGLPPAILRLSHNLPIPILAAPTDVLVKVSHASLNPGGSIITRMVPMAFRTKPSIPDMDFSGTVTKISKSVPVSRELVPGTAVFGTVPMSQHVMGGKGALAEYVAVPAENLVLKPSNVSFEEAAGLPIAGVTATSCMDLAKVKKGESVLVYGASGGIGSLVVQMAKGAVGDEGVVVGVCSGRNLEMVKGLGADEVIDYQEHAPVWKYLESKFGPEPFDAILDCRGVQDLWLHCPKYLKKGKPFVTVGTTPKDYNFIGIVSTISIMISNMWLPTWLGGVDRPYLTAKGFPDLPGMERVARLAAEGMKVPIDSCWDLEDALKAYDIMLSKHARGKVVVKM